MTCESCNRILFYTKPESFEDQLGPTSSAQSQ
jgi:hypothetical protein